MPSFILRDLDPVFWRAVQAKAVAEGTTVKALILRLLTTWLAALVLVTLGGAGCAAPLLSAPTPAAEPTLVVVATPQTQQLRAYNEPRDVYPGGATMIHVGAFARDGAEPNMRGLVGVPVTFTTDGGRLTLLPESMTTGLDGFAAAVLELALADASRVIHVTVTAGGLSTIVQLLVAPAGSHASPTVPPSAGIPATTTPGKP